MYINMYVSIGYVIFDIACFFRISSISNMDSFRYTDTIESKKSYPLSEKDWF